MTSSEYQRIGERIISHLNKLMSGETPGIAVELPFRCENGGMFNVRIDMPTNVGHRVEAAETSYGAPYPKFIFEQLIWVPDEQAFVNDAYVYKKKVKK